jgi:hypothetical protein
VDTTNNNTCETTWQPASTTSLATTLADGTYSWQVRATVNGTTADADNGTWWSFTVSGTVGAFGKLAPTHGTSGLGSTVPLSWGTVTGASYYQLCVDTTNNAACDTVWRSAAQATALDLSGLAQGTYYWQVRALVNGNTVEADGGAWWSFTVGATAGSLVKLTPANGTPGLASAVTLTWGTSTGASYYQVCLDQTDNNICDTGWRPAAQATALGLSGLAQGSYFWQVRALVDGNFVEANSGTWWTFTVGAPLAAFDRRSPPVVVTGPGITATLTGRTARGVPYQVYVDTTNHDSSR